MARDEDAQDIYKQEDHQVFPTVPLKTTAIVSLIKSC